MIIRIVRRIAIIAIILCLMLIGYLKLNPPFVYGAIGTTMDRQTVTLTIGNKSFVGEIEIIEIVINGLQNPTNLNVQTSESSSDIVLTDLVASKEPVSTSESPVPITLIPNSAPTDEKEEDPAIVYGLSITEPAPIETIAVAYRFMGLTFEQTIEI